MAEIGSYIKLPKDMSLKDVARNLNIPVKTLWDSPKNKKIRQLRGDPKDKTTKKPVSLKKGDVVFIPLTPKVEADLKKKLATFEDIVARQRKYQAIQVHHISVLTYNIKNLNRIIAEMNRYTADKIKVVNECRKGMKGVKTKVETVQLVLEVAKSAAKIGAKGYKASKSIGDDLVKANKELVKEVSKKIGEVPKDGAKKLIASTSQKTGYLATAKLSLEIIDNTTSIAFWSLTAAALLDGKSWSEATTYDIDEEMNKNISKLVQLRDKYVRTITPMIAKQKKEISYSKAEIATSKNIIKRSEVSIKKLNVVLKP